MTEPNLYGYLTLLKNKTIIRKYKLAPKAWAIGGGLSNNIRFLTDDDKLFNTQCIIIVKDNGIAVLKNKNAVVPITVNKKRINVSKVLQSGDIIEISTKRFLYENHVLSKKKIKELSSIFSSVPKKLGNQKSSRKTGSSNLLNKKVEFNSEEVSPDKLLPTKKSQLISTSFSKTPIPDKSSNKPSTRISVSTGKMYKFRKPTTKSNKTEKVSSHIPVMNKKPISSIVTSNKIRTKIKLEDVFNNTEPTKGTDKKRSFIEISSTESSPLNYTGTSMQKTTTRSTPLYATRTSSCSQNCDTFMVNFANNSSLQLNSSSISNRRTSMHKSIQKNSANKVTKTPESSFNVSYILDTPIPSGTQKRLSKSFDSSRRLLRKCTTEIKNTSLKRERKRANKSVSLTPRSMQLRSSPNKKLVSRSEAVENLAGISSECISNKEDEINFESNKSLLNAYTKSKRHTNNQIIKNDMKMSEDSVQVSYELNNSSTNINRISIKPQVNEDERILTTSFGKELNSNITENRKSKENNKIAYKLNTSQYSDQGNFEYDGKESEGIRRPNRLNRKQSEQSNTIDNLMEESFEQKLSRSTTERRSTRYSIKENINISENTSVSDCFEQSSYEQDINKNSSANFFSSLEHENPNKTGRRSNNYNKEKIKVEVSPQNANRVSIRHSNKQAVEHLKKSNSFDDHNQENLKSGENIKTRYSLKKAEDNVDVLDSSSRFELLNDMSLDESSSKLNRKSGRRSSKRSIETSPIFKNSEEKLNEASNTSLYLKRSNDYSSSAYSDANKLNISEKITQKSPNSLRVSSMIKFSPNTSGFEQKARTSKTPTKSKSNTSNTSIKIPYNIKEDESLFSKSNDKENTLVTEITTEELNSSEEVYRTPDSVVKIPKQIPKTPKSNVKSRKSVFLHEFEPGEINTDDLVHNETSNDTTIVDNNIPQTQKTPKSNRKDRISNNIQVGQPSIVKDLRKSIASPECNFQNKSSVNECFQHWGNISSKSVASINGSFMQESEKAPFSPTKRSSSILKLSPKSHRKVSIRNSLSNVSTPKPNIKIRHSVTFEITTGNLQSLAQSSPRESKGVVNLNEVSKPKKRSVIPYTEVGGAKQLPSKKRQRSSIQICLPEKRQKMDDEISFEDDYNQKVLQDISNDSSFEDCIDIERKTPISIESKTYTAQKRGLTDPKKSTEKYKRRSLPSEILTNQKNISCDSMSDNEYSFISSTDTSSILFEYHPAINANNLLENNITIKSSSLSISGVDTLTPRKKKLMSASENLNNSGSNTKMLKGEDECDEITVKTENCEMPENASVSGHDDLGGKNIVPKITKNQKEPFSSYENVAGVKKLFKTPKQQKEPACSYEDVQGVKTLLKTPKQQKEPFCSYEDVRGVKKLLKTPKQQKEPTCSYEDVQGVKKLLKTPKQQKEPACSYEDVQGVKKLFNIPKQQKEPACSYEDVRGVKKLFKTPKQQREPACSYEDVRGIKNIFKTPKEPKGPFNSYENVEGIDELFKTPPLPYSRRTRTNTKDDNIQISQEEKVQILNKTKTNSYNPAKSLSESEDTEKDVRSLRGRRRQIKTIQYESESNESTTEDDKSLRKETRKLRKNVKTSASINAENNIKATETPTKNRKSKIEVTQTPTKNLNEDSPTLDENVIKPTIKTRRAKNMETVVAESTTNEEEIQKPNTRTRKGVRKEQTLNEKPKRITRKQEIDDKKKTEKKQSKNVSSATAKKDIEKIKEENMSFEIENSESHKNVITNLIKINQSKRRRAELDDDENNHLSDVKNEIPAIKNEATESGKRRQPKRNKADTSAIAHNSFKDIKHESNLKSNNEENIESLQRKQPKRKKVADINEIEYDTSESIKNKINTADDRNKVTARKMRPRRKNDDVTPAETEVHQNNVVESGRSLRTRRQKKTDTVDVDKNEEYKENVGHLSAKKTKAIASLEDEEHGKKSKRTPKARTVAFENSNIDNSPITVRETRKRTKKCLSKDEIEATSEIMLETEKKTKRAEATVKIEEKITLIRKSTRQRR